MAIFLKWNGSEEHCFYKRDNRCFGLACVIRSFDMVLFDSRFAVYQYPSSPKSHARVYVLGRMKVTIYKIYRKNEG